MAKPRSESQIGWLAALERRQDLLRRLHYLMEVEVGLLPGLLLARREDLSGRLILLRLESLPPHHGVGGLGTQRRSVAAELGKRLV